MHGAQPSKVSLIYPPIARTYRHMSLHIPAYILHITSCIDHISWICSLISPNEFLYIFLSYPAHLFNIPSLSLIFLGRGRKKPAQDLFSEMLSTCPHIAAPHRCCALIEVEEKEKSQIIMTQNLSMLLSKIFHPPDRSLQFHSSRLVFLTLNKTIQPWPSISLPFMQPAFQN